MSVHEGQIILRTQDPEVDSLKRRIRTLEEKLEDSRTDLERERQKTVMVTRAMHSLRGALNPIYKALRLVYNDLDSIGEDEVPSNGTGQPIPSGLYDAWRQRLPPSCGRVIDALLIQPMGYVQLKNYCKMGASTLDQALAKLRANALIEKDGSLNRLKRL